MPFGELQFCQQRWRQQTVKVASRRVIKTATTHASRDRDHVTNPVTISAVN